jgi:hypothetical protein
MPPRKVCGIETDFITWHSPAETPAQQARAPITTHFLALAQLVGVSADGQ